MYLYNRGGWWEELLEDALIVMAGIEQTEWYQTHQTYGNHVFDSILPSEASTAAAPYTSFGVFSQTVCGYCLFIYPG